MELRGGFGASRRTGKKKISRFLHRSINAHRYDNICSSQTAMLQRGRREEMEKLFVSSVKTVTFRPSHRALLLTFFLIRDAGLGYVFIESRLSPPSRASKEDKMEIYLLQTNHVDHLIFTEGAPFRHFVLGDSKVFLANKKENRRRRCEGRHWATFEGKRREPCERFFNSQRTVLISPLARVKLLLYWNFQRLRD